MAKKGKIEIIYLQTQKELHQIADVRGSIRAGGTETPETRAAQYEREGYSGKMCVAPTTNMMSAEDRLLQNHHFRHNSQNQSNLPEDGGWVYVINGKKSAD